MKAALYIRVSTEEQGLEGFSIPAQLNSLTKYCRDNNLEIIKTYIDECSGKNDKRPQFQQMIKDANRKLFNIIICHKYDRFSRDREVSVVVKNKLRKQGINVVSMTEPIEDSPIGLLQEGIIDLFSEYFLKNLSREVKKGMVERASQGLYNGRVPFGYSIKEGKLVINESESKIVKKIFELYINGYGFQKIATWLNENRIYINNRKWVYSDIKRTLTNVKYIGNIYFSGETYPGTHEKIIDNDTWDITQKMLKQNSKVKRGNNYNKFLLLGFLRCGKCGNAFRIKKMKYKDNERWYYCCNMSARSRSICDFSRYYFSEDFEKYVIETLFKLLGDKKSKIEIVNPVNMKEIIEDKKYKIMQELTRAKQAYLAGVFSLHEYSEIKTKLDNELSQIGDSNKDNSEDQYSTDFKEKALSIKEEFKKTKNVAMLKKKLKEYIHEIIVNESDITIQFCNPFL